jgi:putative peptidoglycan lipid II flippase
LADFVTGIFTFFALGYVAAWNYSRYNTLQTMKKNFLKANSRILTRPQRSILSAAAVIMIMLAASRFLGLVRNRILAHYFSAGSLAVYFAAFRLPEMAFEILVFGTLTSAFIPVFTSYLSREKEKEAWRVASAGLNITFLVFVLFAILIFLFTKPLYKIIVPGFSLFQLEKTVILARVLIFAQGFFLLSYFSTAILESLKRFLIPAVAPLFYNLGIILGTIFLSQKAGIIAPAIGAVFGAFMHLLIQLPLVFHLGFKIQKYLGFSHPGVKKIGRLALPRIIELSFLQVSKSFELFLASLVSPAAYTYLTFANSLQLFPVSLFGASLAKASLPTLSYQSRQIEKFKNTLLSSFNQILFLTLPFSVFLAVLRIPAVRLLFGAPRFDWIATVQTGFALSAFCLAIPPQALIFLLNRSFYALHDTLTPMIVSIITLFLNVALGAAMILVFKFPAWGLALAFSLASFFQFSTLVLFIFKKNLGFSLKDFFSPFIKVLSASFLSGGIMYVALKILDRSAWDKRLSFLGKLGLALPTSFDLFVLDTRYTFNLLIVTFLVSLLGGVIYLFLAWRLKIKEFFVFLKLLGKIEELIPFSQRFLKKQEAITIGDSSQIE